MFIGKYIDNPKNVSMHNCLFPKMCSMWSSASTKKVKITPKQKHFKMCQVPRNGQRYAAGKLFFRLHLNESVHGVQMKPTNRPMACFCKPSTLQVRKKVHQHLIWQTFNYSGDNEGFILRDVMTKVQSLPINTTQHKCVMLCGSYNFLFYCRIRVWYSMLLQKCQMSYGAPSTRLWRPCRLHSWVQWLINLTFELAIDYLQSLYQSPWH